MPLENQRERERERQRDRERDVGRKLLLLFFLNFILFALPFHLFLNKFIYFIQLFMAVLGLQYCARAFSSCGERGLLFIAVRGLLIAVASLVVEHGL